MWIVVGVEYVTKTGKVLTDADIEALAAEAEEGYDIEALPERAENMPPPWLQLAAVRRAARPGARRR